MEAEQLDAFDQMTADQFIHCGIPHVSRRQRKKRNRELRLLALASTPAGSSKVWRDNYRAYINSKRWRRFKDSIIRKRGLMCERCGVSGHAKRLDLHHVSYARIGNEQPEDVKLLCRDCHELMHTGKRIAQLPSHK